MTDQTPEPELTPEEIERLRARLAAPDAPAGIVDGARASALAAFDEAHGGDAETPGADVRDIGSSSAAHRRAWYQRVPLGAAAAVVAVVALAGAFSQIDLDSSDGDDTASADFEATGEALEDSGDNALSEEGADDSSSDETAALGGSAEGERAPAASDSGRAVFVYDDLDALVDDYRRRFDGADDQAGDGSPDDGDETVAPSTTSTAAQYRQSSCDAVAAAEVAPDRVVAQDPVLLAPDGDQIWTLVVVYRSDTSGLRVAVVDDASCEVLEDRAL